MSKNFALKPKDWVIFREHPEKLFSRKRYGFTWRIGRVARQVDDEYVEVVSCAPEAPRERKRMDPEREPWNISGIVLPEFPSEYLLCVHLRNRSSISWLQESRARRIKRMDIVLANNVALAETALAEMGGFY